MASQTCTDEHAIVFYKLILEKEFDDGHLQRSEFLLFDNRAEVTRIENATFFRDMQQANKMNTNSIEGLEANLEAVNGSMNAMKRGLRREQQLEATMRFVQAFLNAASMGVGGTLTSVFQAMVDFSDPTHIQTVVEGFNSADLTE